MSRNIKEIGKELLGKSLNSYHRKTGLTQLEKNNEMQDGILDGILSQVDDAYIEKTEQSNVIHLDGSGDGVVVLDSIEGNTMVNLWDFNSVIVSGQAVKTDTTIKIKTTDNRWSNFFLDDKEMFKPSTEYTFIIDVKKNTLTDNSYIAITSSAGGTNRDVFEGYNIEAGKTGIFKKKLTTISDFSQANYGVRSFFDNTTQTLNCEVELNIIILEGDWTNKEIPASYFTGLQSSFEEKVNDEGKYKIEILSQNLNICDDIWEIGGFNWSTGENNNNEKDRVRTKNYFRVSDKKGLRCSASNGYTHIFFYDKNKNLISFSQNTYFKTIPQGSYYIRLLDMLTTSINKKVMLHQNNFEKVETYISNKQNKIKLLIDEPLRGIGNVKDKLCIKDGKLLVERNVFGRVFDGTEDLWLSKLTDSTINVGYGISATLTEGSLTLHMCDRLPNVAHNQWDKPTIGTHCKKTSIFFNIPLNWLGGNTINDVKQYLVNQYNQGTPMKIVHILNEPIYEEVLNEYGEPIILEGYENGTIYINSTIVPTTTVRYTPKMESFKTLNEVSDNNTMLANDINDNIIPYMMDVDLMIMEKEMALMSHKNIRKMEVLDMTSMQKRTQDMLERLIKGKTLTEQECKTRVAVYLNTGKITDEQAKELNFLIDEIYA